MMMGSSSGNPRWGTQNAPLSDGTISVINMVNSEADVLKWIKNYGNIESISKVKETSNPQNYLHIEKLRRDTIVMSPRPSPVVNHVYEV
jgi:hypothetical protein